MGIPIFFEVVCEFNVMARSHLNFCMPQIHRSITTRKYNPSFVQTAFRDKDLPFFVRSLHVLAVLFNLFQTKLYVCSKPAADIVCDERQMVVVASSDG
jgi:hypothetical protein